MRVALPEVLVLKENKNLNLLFDDEGQLIPTAGGKTLHLDRSYRYLSGVSIQMKSKRKRNTYCCTNAIRHIMSVCQNCKLCNSNVTIDNEMENKMKMALADHLTTVYKNELMKKQSACEHYYYH